MAIANYSKGFMKGLATVGSFKANFDGMVASIRTGTLPANPEAPITGTNLGILSVNGDGVTGVTLDAAATEEANGDIVLNKAPAETWSFIITGGTAGALVGIAGYARFYDPGTDDPTTQDTAKTKKRIDVAITQSGGLLNLADLNVRYNATNTVSSCAIVFDRQAES